MSVDIADWVEGLAAEEGRPGLEREQLITAADVIRQSRAMLMRLEWTADRYSDQVCPVCEAPELTGVHVAGCKLMELIDYIRADDEDPEGEQ